MSEYLYLEAVNLGGVIDDTEDLSTRRAGGYMLLKLVHKVKLDCATWLDDISVGASQGLFALKAGQRMAQAREQVMRVLKQDLYAQATVLVADTVTDGHPESPGQYPFVAAREHLKAVVRRRQLNTLSWVTDFGQAPMAAAAGGKPPAAVCEIDAVRPATQQMHLKSEDNLRWQKSEDNLRWHSHSVAERRKEGRELRQAFYGRELNSFPDVNCLAKDEYFTDHFEELSSHRQDERGVLRPTLDRKIAVFYADGDGFGALARCCKTAQDLKVWDATVQTQRRTFLAALLQLLDQHPHGRSSERHTQRGNPKPKALRVETLMWGGDEFRLVLPAWLGFEAAHLFFKTCNVEWPAGTRRGHSAALVFAHHNAPISQLDRLSKTLAEQGKTGRYKGHDSLHWIVLESFDHAGTAVHDDGHAWWRQRGLPQLNWDCMALNPPRIQTLMEHLPKVADALPRRNLYRLLDLLPRWAAAVDDEKRLVRQSYDNLHAATAADDCRAAWRLCWKALQPGGPPGDLEWPDVQTLHDDFAKPEHLNAWLTLAELWDYLLPCLAADVAGETKTDASAEGST